MVSYRLANESDYEGINAFHNRIYKKNRTMEQFRWEFHDGPFGKSVYVVALDGEKVVGTNCVIPMVLANGQGEEVLTGKSEDTLVDPAYRGRNIFENIYAFLFEECRHAGIKAIWGYTSAKKPFQKIGFSVPFDHSQSLLVNRPLLAYRYLASLNPRNGLKEKLKIAGLCILSALRARLALPAGRLSYRITEDEPVTEGAGDLVRRDCSAHSGLWFLHQNRAFQQWRVYGNPHYHRVHTVAFYSGDEKLAGLVVFNSHPDGVAYVNQSNFDPSVSSRERSRMLCYAAGRIFAGGAALIRNWHFDTNPVNRAETACYAGAGFTILRKGIGFVWKELDPLPAGPSSLYLSRLSTEGVI